MIEKDKISLDDLVSFTKPEDNLSVKNLEKQKEASMEDLLKKDYTVLQDQQEGRKEILEELFFGQTHQGEKLIIEGLAKEKKISENIAALKPVNKIFNLARDIITNSKKDDIKNNFYNKEEINIKNGLNIGKGLTLSTAVIFVLVAFLFAILKNRVIMIASVFLMCGTILSGFLWHIQKMKANDFYKKKFKSIEGNISELQVRLTRIKNDESYFEAVRLAQPIPNFEINFSAKVGHLLGLLDEYKLIDNLDYVKKDEYYKEMIKICHELVHYEQNVYDRFFQDKLEGKI